MADASVRMGADIGQDFPAALAFLALGHLENHTHTVDLGTPTRRTGSGENGDVIENHSGVLDEHRVRAVISRRHLTYLPPCAAQRIHVLGPLASRRREVDR